MARKRKTPRRGPRTHFIIGSMMLVDRRQAPERRAAEIDGRKTKPAPKRRG